MFMIKYEGEFSTTLHPLANSHTHTRYHAYGLTGGNFMFSFDQGHFHLWQDKLGIRQQLYLLIQSRTTKLCDYMYSTVQKEM